MSDVPTLRECSSTPGAGDATLTLELADLHDRGVEADREARRRLIRACFVTLIAPVNFLIQALLFWQHGWPSGGAAGLALVSLIAMGAWLWWAHAWLRALQVRSYASRRRIDLNRGLRPMIRTSVLWSTEPL